MEMIAARSLQAHGFSFHAGLQTPSVQSLPVPIVCCIVFEYSLVLVTSSFLLPAAAAACVAVAWIQKGTHMRLCIGTDSRSTKGSSDRAGSDNSLKSRFPPRSTFYWLFSLSPLLSIYINAEFKFVCSDLLQQMVIEWGSLLMT